VLREINKYGVDHRTLFNLTPLMTAAFVGNLALVKVICEAGADKTLLANNGLNAWQMVLARVLLEPGEIKQVDQLYRLLAPEAITVQIDGRLEKLDDRSMFGFLLNVFFSLWYGHIPNEQIMASGQFWAHGAVTAANLADLLAVLPDSVLPPMKKQRSYISRYLSANEVSRDTPNNRKLFKRYKRGHYVLNPQLQIRQGDNWHTLHDLLHFDGWSYRIPDLFLEPRSSQYDLGFDMVKITESFDMEIDGFKRWIKSQLD
jgi:hypothetical protein